MSKLMGFILFTQVAIALAAAVMLVALLSGVK